MINFVFQQPATLAALLLAFPLIWLLRHARVKRLKLIEAMGGGLSTHRKLRDVLRVSAFILMVVALARPGYSPHPQSISNTGRDIVFALDVSQSMLAEDTYPSRLEVAKQGIRDAIDVLGNQRVGLVVYAGNSSILCPLTYDHDFARFTLEEANPRTVDFGGTTLQSAVEKIVDQVFMEGRENLQDLVVLTDGGDHGSKIPRIIEIINEKQVDVLLVGIGDPTTGSPIPVKNAAGKVTHLEHNGSTIHTKLDGASLRQFANQSPRAEYMAVGTKPFNLGTMYLEYVKDRPQETTESETGILDYQEAAIFFLIPAILLLILSECWGLKGLQLGHAAVIALTFALTASPIQANDQLNTADFSAASILLKKGEFEEAELHFAALYLNMSEQGATVEALAAVQFNRGLCQLKLSQGVINKAPEIALTYAHNAQLHFLSAKRYSPQLQRSGRRLVSTSTWISEITAILDAQAQTSEELEKQIKELIELLQEDLDSQKKLRHEIASTDISRYLPEAQKEQGTTPLAPPADLTDSFRLRQKKIVELSLAAQTRMLDLHTQIAIPLPDQAEPQPSLMSEPLKLITLTIAQQQNAVELVKTLKGWSNASNQQKFAERHLFDMIEMLSGNSQQQSEESDEGEVEEEEQYDESEESQSGETIAQDPNADLSASAQMQPLPTPNYSAEDILKQEQGNLQFRQQKRANNNASKVEKDY